MDAKINVRESCRVCGSKKLRPIISLGNQYITNFTDVAIADAARGALDLVLCDIAEGGCGLLQLRHTTDQDALYRKYWYRSGISTTMVAALKDIVRCSEKLVKLGEGDIVVDIGSNDGTLLRHYENKNIVTVGFEPSNLWELGIPGTSKAIHDYFNYETFSCEIGDKKAKIITAVAMFYDLEDPNKFVDDIKKCLDKDGIFIIQMNYLGLMLENNTFDNISHEHLEYYSLLSLDALLKRHNLEIFDVELNDVNGGSYRVYVKHKDGAVVGLPGCDARVQALKNYEKSLGLDTAKAYQDFAGRISSIKEKLVGFLEKEVQAGKKIYIYGASTRGLVVLQYCGIDNKLISAATDKNPDKWGKYIVGTGIPIIPVEQYQKDKPDYLFVLPYQFLKEIVTQEKEFLNNGGKMIFALPEFRIIDSVANLDANPLIEKCLGKNPAMKILVKPM